MTWIESNAQVCQRSFRIPRWQRFCRTPEPRHVRARSFVFGKPEREETLRGTVLQDARRVIVDLEQIVSETVRAINVIDEMRELVARDCLLVMLEHIPARLTAEDGDVV